MFPWMLGNPTMAGQMSLLSMMYPPQQGGFFNMFAPQRRSGDRSDQQGNSNQPDRGNVMAPPQGTQGGPDNNPQSGYDPNTITSSPAGFDPGWMRLFAGTGASAKRNPNPFGMGAVGLSMLQPRQPTHTGPYPWI